MHNASTLLLVRRPLEHQPCFNNETFQTCHFVEALHNNSNIKGFGSVHKPSWLS